MVALKRLEFGDGNEGRGACVEREVDAIAGFVGYIGEAFLVFFEFSFTEKFGDFSSCFGILFGKGDLGGAIP